MNGESPPPTGFKRFIEVFIENWKQLVSTMLGLGAAPPLLDLVFNIGPPWPQHRAVAFFTTVVLWMVLLWSYTNWKGATKRTITSVINRSFVALIIFIGVYLWSFASFTMPTSSPSDLGVIGLTPTQQTKQMLANGLTLDRIFANAAFESTIVWEPQGVAFCRTLLLISWLFLFGLLATITSCFLLQFKEDS